jgi:DNA replication protein DnaC
MMLNEPTMERLKALKLDAMAAAWSEHQGNGDAGQLSFDERFALLVDAEWLARENKRRTRLLQGAKLRYPHACVEDIDYAPKREIDKAVLRQLATCRWIDDHRSVILTGATGTGKSYIACALAQQACRKGYSALYKRAPRLFPELALAKADGTYERLLGKLARIDMLIIDDWAMAPATEAERRDLLEVLEDREGRRATCIASQLPHKLWHEHLGEPMTADAILDRLVHGAYKLALKGPSRRKNGQEDEEQEVAKKK